MPLAQHALSARLGWPLIEIAIGVQVIDSGEPETHSFSEDEVSVALEEFEGLGVQVSDLL